MTEITRGTFPVHTDIQYFVFFSNITVHTVDLQHQSNMSCGQKYVDTKTLALIHLRQLCWFINNKNYDVENIQLVSISLHSS
ncbi:MAG: hypothetical protein ATN36_04115 [Epulopiscium sp. Nele67-Bin005]|nr:MAG: hypothetical protein ATN36_04115 [Epulopiscium sp. Nele67-Bin005]